MKLHYLTFITVITLFINITVLSAVEFEVQWTTGVCLFQREASRSVLEAPISKN